MTARRTPCKTTCIEGVLGNDEATLRYTILKETIDWQDGVRSRKGFTRKASAIQFGENCLVDEAVTIAVSVLGQYHYRIAGIYLNNYETGEMWTPNHTHPGTHQLVISLGAERTLVIGKKKYQMTNGSAAIFGSGVHGVPKSDTSQGRISIAAFLIPLR